ncbi:MAG: ABC transporter substrate-binding protein [Acidobacteriota bacterium]|nr:ABC transporter substrate-binding protein [Acidobacteriota bacterium]
MKRNNIVGLIVLIIAMTMIVTGLTFLKQSRDERQAIQRVKIGYIPIADTAQLYVADAQGFFSAAGITPELISFSGGAKILEALGTGDIDIGFTGTVPLIQAKSRGINLVTLAGGSIQTSREPYQALVVPTDSEIEEITELEGKVVATNTYRSIDHVFTIALLEAYGIKKDAISYIEVPFPQMEQALAAEQVDAASMIEPFLTIAEERGSIRILSYHIVEVQPDFEMTTYVSTSRWYQQNKHLAEGIRLAFQSATEWAEGNREEVKRLVTVYTKIKPEVASKMRFPNFGNRLSKEQLQITSSLLLRLGFIDSQPNLEEVFPEGQI